ncbi:hypothetical protein [Desulfitobacterium chlororespirans]|uniref:hypothetical protein n=1 Tax=Desulfitobacterium chlororespirans TaxID=51616 RepID=UPI0015B4F683
MNDNYPGRHEWLSSGHAEDCDGIVVQTEIEIQKLRQLVILYQSFKYMTNHFATDGTILMESSIPTALTTLGKFNVELLLVTK